MSADHTKAGMRLTDSTLRDGSHAIAHQWREPEVRSIVRALDAAGVEVIEVSHGDGLGGSSFNYGFSAENEITLVKAAVDEAEHARIACLLLPGIGTADDVRAAHDAGARIIRVATHCTEADISVQHFTLVRALGLEAVGFLMLSHRISPEDLAAQARIMVEAGAQCVYVVDSAGALLPSSTAQRVEALVAEIGMHAEVGFHGHQNLALGVGNSMAAYAAGARQMDGALCGLGAGAGNAPTEVLAATFARAEVPTPINLDAVLDAAENLVRAVMPTPVVDRGAIIQGYEGVYSSFLLHAQRAGERYGVPPHELLRRAGRAGYVGGQEDMLIDLAISLAAELGARAPK
jgi:4-hydroxy 2-oxovalerate aldolase